MMIVVDWDMILKRLEQMRLGTGPTDAVYAVVYLAIHDDEAPIQGQEIAAALEIPVESLLKNLQQLVRSRVLVSKRGRHGGFRLQKTPAQTTLLEIVEATDGKLTGEVGSWRDVPGMDETTTKLGDVCRRISEQTASILRDTTVSQLMANSR